MTVEKPAVNEFWRFFLILDPKASRHGPYMTRPIARIARTALRAALVAAVAGLVAAGCTENIRTRGNLPDPKVVAEIKPGKQTREQITRMIGTPSTVATFEKEIWIYIGGRVKTKSFFNPEVLERKILTVEFDKNGVVKHVRSLDATDARQIELVQRETPTKGKELTVLQQLIGNLGRFGTPEQDLLGQ